MTNEELAKRIQAGEDDLLPLLWEQVRRLVSMLMGREYRRHMEWAQRAGITLEDLEQEGYFAFLHALKAYRPAGEYHFTAYLQYHIQNQSNTALGLRSQIKRHDPVNTAANLDAPIPGADDLTLGDSLADDAAEDALYSVEDRLDRQALHQAMEYELGRLRPSQEAVLRSRFYRGLTLEQVAAERGITREKARTEQEAAFRRLRRKGADNRLRSFVEDRDDLAYTLGLKGTGLSRFKDTRTSATEWAAIKLLEVCGSDSEGAE